MRVTLRMEMDAEDAGMEVPADAFDLRANPGAIEQVEPARRHKPLRGLLVALNSTESVFASVGCRTWTKDAAGMAAAAEFGSRVDMVFAAQRHNFERGNYESLGAGLRELLEREASGDTLEAEVCVLRCNYRESGRAGFALRLTLTGRGENAAQAELRWGLGVAHLQQALLYLSRAVRQQQARAN